MAGMPTQKWCEAMGGACNTCSGALEEYPMGEDGVWRRFQSDEGVVRRPWWKSTKAAPKPAPVDKLLVPAAEEDSSLGFAPSHTNATRAAHNKALPSCHLPRPVSIHLKKLERSKQKYMSTPDVDKVFDKKLCSHRMNKRLRPSRDHDGLTVH